MVEGEPVRLLIDQNLAAGLARHIADVFPGSRHVRDFGLRAGSDATIAKLARRERLVVLTKDAGFPAAARGLAKVILLQVGNSSTAEIEQLLRLRTPDVHDFASDPRRDVLTLP